MKLMIACVVMYATAAFASASQSGPVSASQLTRADAPEVNVDPPGLEVRASSDAVRYGSCTGTPPCCEWDGEGNCTVIAFCWGGGWACP